MTPPIASARTDGGPLRLRATLQPAGERWLATCLDLEASGEGETREKALSALRAAIDDRERPEAVAPPEEAAAPTVEIVVVEGDADERAEEPTGPGDAPD